MTITPNENVSVILDKKRQYLEIRLNRPKKKNAINLDMYTAMSEALGAAINNKEVKSVLISAAGDNFTSGNDLVDFANANDFTNEHNPIFVFMRALAMMPKPVVAAVNGTAIGIGTTMLLHCDMVFCTADSSFSMPFVKLGLCPEFAASITIPSLAGMHKACEWLLLGEPFDAEEALTAGVVNAVVASPREKAIEVCDKFSKLPPKAVQNTKMLLRKPQLSQIQGVIQNEIEMFSQSLEGCEFAEAVAAFFDKREPDFSSL